MSGTLSDFQTVEPPSRADTELAQTSSRQLARLLASPGQEPYLLRIEPPGGTAEAISIPITAFRLLNRILAEMAEGKTVELVALQSELTVQQGADLLNVSLPYFEKLLDDGKIASQLVGNLRSIRLNDLLAYQREDYAARMKIADQLTAEAQELGMGY